MKNYIYIMTINNTSNINILFFNLLMKYSQKNRKNFSNRKSQIYTLFSLYYLTIIRYYV